MNCLILAAGYGTRMQGVIGDLPKALINIGSMTLLDHLVGQLSYLDLPVTLVTNQHFYGQFERWSENAAIDVNLLNNGSTCADNRLGAIGDMAFAIETAGLNDDLMVLAADNFLPFSLAGMLTLFAEYRDITLAIWENDSLSDQRRRGVVAVDSLGCVSEFVEKPAQPASLFAAAPIYILPARHTGVPREYLKQGGDADAPGHLFAALAGRLRMRAWAMPARVLDVGNPESYAHALRMLTD